MADLRDVSDNRVIPSCARDETLELRAATPNVPRNEEREHRAEQQLPAAMHNYHPV
jgi:hypothetical protein